MGTEIQNSLIISACVGACYYATCSYYSLLTQKALNVQMGLFSLSAFTYNYYHDSGSTEKTLTYWDILPIALIALSKVQATSWKAHALSSMILGTSQIGIRKSILPALDEYQNTSMSNPETEWLIPNDLMAYLDHLKIAFPNFDYNTPFPHILNELVHPQTLRFLKTTKTCEHMRDAIGSGHKQMHDLKKIRNTFLSKIEHDPILKNDQLEIHHGINNTKAFEYIRSAIHDGLDDTAVYNSVSESIRKDLEKVSSLEYFKAMIQKNCNLEFFYAPFNISGNHWVLIHINKKKKVVEYYDSKCHYGNFDKVTAMLQKLADELGYEFKSRITKSLQPDGYQCGVWIAFFMKKLLEDPDVDFNTLNTNIADFRKEIIPYFGDERWKQKS